MKHWRVTKYNPTYRDKSGAYRREDWTSFDDIGRPFNGALLTLDEYMQTEDRYVSTALHFARAANVSKLVPSQVESSSGNDLTVTEGQPIDIAKIPEILRSILRSCIWCKLEDPP